MLRSFVNSSIQSITAIAMSILLGPVAHGATVSYEMYGYVSLSSGTDTLSLAGSSFSWTLSADTNLVPVNFHIDSSTGSVSATYSVSIANASIAFTNRPMNAPDVTVGYSSPASMQIAISNAPSTDNWDIIYFAFDATYYLDGPGVGLLMPMGNFFSFVFPASYWPDLATGPLPGPVAAGDTVFAGYHMLPWMAVDNSAYYSINSLGGSAELLSPVPIPATAWLFGSALGVMGWLRRNAAADT